MRFRVAGHLSYTVALCHEAGMTPLFRLLAARPPRLEITPSPAPPRCRMNSVNCVNFAPERRPPTPANQPGGEPGAATNRPFAKAVPCTLSPLSPPLAAGAAR